MKSILLMACDPGGANTIIAMADALSRQGWKFYLYGKDVALKRYQECGFTGQNVSLLGYPNISEWTNLLNLLKPDIVLTGTSANDFSERFLWLAASQLEIPSIAIIDHWSNLGLRFSEYGYRDRENYETKKKHPYLPDRIIIMDRESRQELITNGIEPERILPYGQPYFNYLLSQSKNRILMEQGRECRLKYGLEINDFMVLYASEPIRQEYGFNEDGTPYWGYDEISIFKELINALKIIVARGLHQRIMVVIKPHPLEKHDNYSTALSELDINELEVRLAGADEKIWDLIMASDLVCGMTSMVLLESVWLSRIVISVRIGLRRNSPFILQEKGFLAPVMNQEELVYQLEDTFQGKKSIISAWSIDENTADKIIELLEELKCRT